MKKYLIILTVLSLIGASIIFFVTQNYGVGVTPDSIGYLHVAEQFTHGETISLTNEPPLYPAALALLSSLFKIDPLSSARIINVILFGLTIFLSGLLYKRYLSSSLIFNIIGIITILVSIPLIPVYLEAWTEPLFILFVTLSLVIFELYSVKKNKASLLLLSLSVALACLTRYPGVVLILMGIMSIVLLTKQKIKTKIFDSFYFVLISSLPIALWIIRNILISGKLAGDRIQAAPSSLWENINSTVISILGWYLPYRNEINPILIAGVFCIIGLSIGIYYKEIWIENTPNLSWQYPYMFLIAIYIILIITASTLSFSDPVGDRFLSPIFIPFNLLLLYYLLELIKPFRLQFGEKKAEYLLIILLIVGIIFPTIRTGNTLLNQRNEGTSYTSKSWRESETVQYFISKLSTCPVYSNGSDAIHFLTGKQVNSVPVKKNGALVVSSISQLKNNWPNEDNICLVWFDQITWRKNYFTPEELISITDLRNQVKLKDGTIYYLSKINP